MASALQQGAATFLGAAGRRGLRVGGPYRGGWPGRCRARGRAILTPSESPPPPHRTAPPPDPLPPAPLHPSADTARTAACPAPAPRASPRPAPPPRRRRCRRSSSSPPDRSPSSAHSESSIPGAGLRQSHTRTSSGSPPGPPSGWCRQVATAAITTPSAASFSTSARCVRAGWPPARICPLAAPGWFDATGQHVARVAQRAQARHHARQEPHVVGVEGAHHRAQLGVAVEVDERPVAVEEDALHAHASAAGPSALTSWRRRSQMRWWNTSWKPSTWGVEVWPPAERGTTTLASAMARRAPPS